MTRDIYVLFDAKRARRRRTMRLAASAFMSGVALGAAILFLPPLWAPAINSAAETGELVARITNAAPAQPAQSNTPVAAAVRRDSVESQRSDCSRIIVHDGDTFRCNGMKVRLVAASGPVDAPEFATSPRCAAHRDGWCDQALAERARDWLDDMLSAGPVRLNCTGSDRYGRALCRASVNGRDAGDALVAEGFGKIEDRWR